LGGAAGAAVLSARKICIVGLDSYGMLTGDPRKYVGGEAVQHVLLARAWRDLGCDVSIIVYDEGSMPQEIDGIRVVPAYVRTAGIPGLRFFHPRASKLVAAMIAADAEIYYQSPAGANTGITAWFCRMTGRKFLFRVASDSDVEKEHGRIRFARDRMLYDFGLKRADAIAVQTDFQAQQLRQNHGLDSTVINMLVEPPARRATPLAKDIDVLWVSNLRPLKRPELALELARQLPDIRFTLAGGPMPHGRTYFDDVAAAAARLPNVTMLGPVAYADTGALFDRAKLLLNTSSVEGFPNTFLQAWIRGVPVVSFFDPDGLVQRLQLGRIATSMDDMREALRSFIDVQTYRENLGRRARDYAAREYTSAAAARYLSLLEPREGERLRATDGGTVP
jgi:glycosyltransferase involved in cell wall biosynthesis